MILAWSVTEIIRYTFYFFSVIGVNIPPLTYLRYSTFLLLYPIGAASEAFLSFSTLPPLSTLPFWPESLTAWSILNKLPDGWRKAVMKTGFGRSVVWKLAKAGAGAKKGVQGTWGWMEIVRLGIFFIWWPGKCSDC
jgi:very-long-chain (3R)-3-hydroxyacyl-CoA dehydratase